MRAGYDGVSRTKEVKIVFMPDPAEIRKILDALQEPVKSFEFWTMVVQENTLGIPQENLDVVLASHVRVIDDLLREYVREHPEV